MIYFTLFFALAFAQSSQRTESNPDCNSAYCSECGDNLKCTECIDNYHLVNGECVYDYLCSDFDSDSFGNGICISCEEGYKFDINKRECVKDKFEPCLQYEYDLKRDYHICMRCETGYALYKGKCIDCTEEQPHCLEFDTNLDDVCGHCIRCEGGYELKDCKCVSIFDDYCINGKDESNDYCYDGCKPGYYRNNEYKCVKGTIDGCAVYKEYFDEGECHEECEICIDGYELHEGRCYKGETKHCISYDYTNGNYVCKKCEEGYSVDKEFECFQCKVENCLTCSAFDHSKCLACNKGYSVDSKTGKCQKCAEGCSECEADGKCSSCNDGYSLASGKCFICNVPNCSDCEDEGKCSETGCKNGFGRNDKGECKECNVDNCKLCKNKFDECDDGACIDGYYKDSTTKKCEKCHEGCFYCNDNNECFEYMCLPGYYYDEDYNQCKKCSDGCSECSYNYYYGESCDVECDKGFYTNSNDRCSPCMDHCLECSNDYSCYTCEEGYYRNGNRCSPCIDHCLECTNEYYCDICEEGYSGIYDNSEYKCIKCSDGCEECEIDQSDSSKTVCTQCKNGFKLVDGSCTECSSNNCNSCIDEEENVCNVCKKGFTMYNDYCQQCSSNCNECTINGEGIETCLQCSEGYGLDQDGYCKQCSSECKQCRFEEGNEICEECIDNYGLNQDGSCKQCSSNCNECTINGEGIETCSQCSEGYGLNQDGLCKQCSNGCKQCRFEEGNEICEECSDNYGFDQDGSCQSCSSPECLSCDFSSGVEICTLCSQGYANQGDHYCPYYPISNCLVTEHFNEEYKCKQCNEGYVWSNSDEQCVDCSLANCGKCTIEVNENCYSCKEGYSFDGSECKKCESIANCGSCSFDGETETCLTCKEGYYPKEGECVECNEIDPNCNQCVNNGNLDDSTCNICKEGYNNDYSDLCEKNECYDENCELCSDYYECLKCKDDLIPDGSTCYNYKELYDNCDEIGFNKQGDPICSKCSEGYEFIYRNGYKDGYDTYGECYKVSEEIEHCYVSTEEYNYYETIKCLSCDDQYQLEDDYCVPQNIEIKDCETYSSDKKSCLKCKEGLLLSFDNLECYKPIEHCIGYYYDKRCYECDSGYELSEDKNECKEITDGCLQYNKEENDETNSEPRVCILCRDGWYMKEDYTCAKCISPCKTCVHESDECIEYNEIEGCYLYEKDGKCKECDAMYTLKKGKCELMKEYHSCYMSESYGNDNYERYFGYMDKEKCSLCVVTEYDEKLDRYIETRVYYPENGKCGVKSIAILLLLVLLTFLF